mmetsp:Transcript_115257/g.366420  ORF Transcript_115257/g.366420 Transcript_115257/m.366420 type:complete len:254 (+) Transcript_115257:983-1744(+)
MATVVSGRGRARVVEERGKHHAAEPQQHRWHTDARALSKKPDCRGSGGGLLGDHRPLSGPPLRRAHQHRRQPRSWTAAWRRHPGLSKQPWQQRGHLPFLRARRRRHGLRRSLAAGGLRFGARAWCSGRELGGVCWVVGSIGGASARTSKQPRPRRAWQLRTRQPRPEGPQRLWPWRPQPWHPAAAGKWLRERHGLGGCMGGSRAGFFGGSGSLHAGVGSDAAWGRCRWRGHVAHSSHDAAGQGPHGLLRGLWW